MSQERRVDTRYTINQIIKIKGQEEEFFWAVAKDVSASGFSAISSTIVDPLTEVFAMLTIPSATGPKTIKVEGYVIYCRKEQDDGYHFGVHINEINDTDAVHFAKFFQHCQESTCPDE